jgi:hypothetical protein
MSKKFKWVVEFEIPEDWVRDGFDLTDKIATGLLSHFPFISKGASAKVTKAPSSRRMLLAQGHSEDQVAEMLSATDVVGVALDPVKVWEFTDAQEMKRIYPNTFEAPSEKQLSMVEIGDAVKVCAIRERFWVHVTAIDGNSLIGVIDNDLLFSEEHGLKYEDIVKFELRHIFSV